MTTTQGQAPIDTNTASGAADLTDTVCKAMRRTWQLGQIYWQQADSESFSQQKKSETTHAAFVALLDDTRAVLASAAAPAEPAAKSERWNPLEGGNPETALQMAAVIAHRDATQPASKEQTMTEPTELLPSARSVAHTRHGHSSRQLNSGAKDSPTYRSWIAMRSRCNLDGRDNSDRYREKGVSYDARWESFEIFLRDMGERPHGMTLDRWPDRDGNYGPSNCRWATPVEQARNTRRNVLTFDTAVEVALMRLKGHQCKVIAEKFGISESLPREIVKGRCWKDALSKAKELLCMKP